MEYIDRKNELIVHTQKNIFSRELETNFIFEGNSIYNIFEAKLLNPDTLNARVYVNDIVIQKKCWRGYIPRKKDIVIIKIFPQGGNNEDPNKEIRTLALITITAVAIGTGQWWVASGLWGGAFVGGAIAAGISIGGTALINSVIPIPEANVGSVTTAAPTVSQNYMITGVQNSLNLFGAVPKVLGTHRIFPPLAAKPYTELRGDVYYLRMLFCLGYAPLEYEQEKIGETSVDSFIGWDSNYYIASDVLTSARIYTRDITEENINVELENIGDEQHTGDYTERTSEAETSEISIDMYCPSLFSLNSDDGERELVTVGITIEIKLTAGSTWYNVVTDTVLVNSFSIIAPGYIYTDIIFVNGDSGEHKRYNVRLVLNTADQYDIRIRRVFYSSNGDELITDAIYWSTFRSVVYESPLGEDIDPNTALMEVEVQSSEQLTGVLDTYNLVVKNHAQVYNDISETWAYEQTNNPAWAYTDILIGNATPRPLDTSRIDADAFKEWADWCDASGFEFNGVVSSETLVYNMLKQIAGIGRASPNINNSGLYSIVQDVAQTIPVQVFTPRNSWNFSGSKDFAARPNAYSITFNDQDSGYEPNEIIICNDECSTDPDVGLPYPDKLNAVSLTGATSSDQVWKQGRYYLSQGELRPELYSLQVDVEHLICNRGDLVLLTYDVPLIGLGQARVKSITVDGSGYAISIEIDDVFTMELDNTYGIYIRNSTNGIFSASIVTNVGETSILDFSTPVTTSFIVGDLIAFGQTDQISADMVVKDIIPASDLSANVVLVDAAPDIHDADTGEIPSFESHVTLPPDPKTVPPDPPLIDNVVSDGSILRISTSGDYISRILISFSTENSGSTIVPKNLETQYRIDEENTVWNSDLPNVSAQTGQVYIFPVVDKETYEIRIRFLSFYDIPSEWVYYTETVIGKSQPIAPPTEFTSDIVNNLVELSWVASVAPDLARHSLKYDALIPVLAKTDDLIGYWALNGNTDDGSGNGNDGVIEGIEEFPDVRNLSFITAEASFIEAEASFISQQPSVGQGITFVDGVFGQAAFFYGDNDRMDCGNGAPLDDIGTASFTICFWMLSGNGIIANCRLFSKEEDTENRIIISSNQTNNEIVVELTKGGVSVSHIFTEINPFTNTWQFVAIDVDRTVNTLTVFQRDDLTQVAITSEEVDLSSLPADISNDGNLSWGADDVGPFPYVGTLDDLRIYDVSLTTQELRDLSLRWENYADITINDTNKVQLPAIWEGTRQFYLKAIDTTGNESPIVSTSFTLTQNKILILISDVIDNNVQLKWTVEEGSLPIDLIEIRKGDVFETAEVIGNKKGNFTFIQETLSGTYTYWAVPIDTAGNYGFEASITSIVDEPPDYVLNRNWVLFFNSVDADTESNICYLGDGTAIVPCFDTETFAEHFTNNANTTFQDFIDDTYLYLVQPVPTTAEYSQASDYETALGASTISISLDKVDYEDGAIPTPYIATKLLIGDSWTEVQADKTFVNNFQYVRDRYTFTSDGRDFSVLTNHSVKLDTKEKTDAGNGSITTDPENGVVVTFNKTFADIISITVAAKGADTVTPDVFDQLVTAIYDFEDIPNPTQFTVYLYDDVGDKTTGDFSWSARGV
jgi:hypothetical protein